MDSKESRYRICSLILRGFNSCSTPLILGFLKTCTATLSELVKDKDKETRITPYLRDLRHFPVLEIAQPYGLPRDVTMRVPCTTMTGGASGKWRGPGRMRSPMNAKIY